MPAWWLTACLAVALREVFALYLLCNTDGITGRRSGDFFFFLQKQLQQFYKELSH